MEGGKTWAFRGMTIVELPPAKVYEALRDTNRWKEWDSTLEMLSTIEEIDEANKMIHLAYKPLYNVFSARDMVAFTTCGKVYSAYNCKKDYIVYYRSVDHFEYPAAKTGKEREREKENEKEEKRGGKEAGSGGGGKEDDEEDEVIRIESLGSGFVIEPFKLLNNCSMVTYVSNIDWKAW